MSYSNKESVESVRGTDQDFEFYPTTDEIIDIVKTDINKQFKYVTNKKILDCGAGDGRVLKALSEFEISKNYHKIDSEHRIYLYAIEKSEPLIKKLPEYVFPIGTDFHDQNLMTFDVDILFCNPPYSEFKLWFLKIIKESMCKVAYLVIPDRWANDEDIQTAILERKVKKESLGFYDFQNADRTARCNVEIVKLSFESADSSLSNWIKENFKIPEKEDKIKETLKDRIKKEEEKLSNGKSLVQGRNYVSTLVNLYNQDIEKLFESFSKICSIDSDNLEFFELDIDNLSYMVKHKAESIRTKYWTELIENISEIKERFSSSVRYHFIKEMNSNRSAEFTPENIHSFIIWVLKNAKHYDDLMFESTINSFISSCNIESYKSNQSRFVKGEWEYKNYQNSDKFKFSTTKRIILENFYWKNDLIFYGKLNTSCANIIDDLLILAESRGFKTSLYDKASVLRDLDYGQSYNFKAILDNEERTLFTIKLFKKGSVHINFDLDFINFINIEIGKRKGWVTTPQEASEEFDIPLDQTALLFSKIEKDFFNEEPLLLI